MGNDDHQPDFQHSEGRRAQGFREVTGGSRPSADGRARDQYPTGSTSERSTIRARHGRPNPNRSPLPRLPPRILHQRFHLLEHGIAQAMQFTHPRQRLLVPAPGMEFAQFRRQRMHLPVQ